MNKLIVLASLMLPACCETPFINNDEGTGLVVADRDLCTYYELLADRAWEEREPYIAPVSLGVYGYVNGEFSSLWGESDLQADGTTFIWAPKELHRENGIVDLVGVGRRPNEVAFWCSITPVIRVAAN